jgi:hydroxymethylbilane synthase
LQSHPFRIGTRGSALALWQANTVRDRLLAAHDLAPEAVEIVTITTTGDRVLDRRLADFGGKGLFVKELELALLDNRIDCAVHSLKDVPTVLPEGLQLACFLEREDPRDAFLSRKARRLDDLPQGGRVGTASPRREAILRHLRPDLDVVLLRGNVDTRIAKMDAGEVDAAILACAGLKRLERTHDIAQVLPPDQFLPAIGQGIVAVEIRASDAGARALLEPLDHAPTMLAARTERAFLGLLDGSCRSPIAGHAEVGAEAIAFEGWLMTPDGAEMEVGVARGAREAPEAVGREAARQILEKASPRLLSFLEE